MREFSDWMVSFRRLITTALALSMASSASAVVLFSWTAGGSNDDWFNAANWKIVGSPTCSNGPCTTDDDAEFDEDGPYTVNLPSTAQSIREMRIESDLSFVDPGSTGRQVTVTKLMIMGGKTTETEVTMSYGKVTTPW